MHGGNATQTRANPLVTLGNPCNPRNCAYIGQNKLSNKARPRLELAVKLLASPNTGLKQVPEKLNDFSDGSMLPSIEIEHLLPLRLFTWNCKML
jgi:hypothetical protein